MKLNLINEKSNICRLVHGEGDGCPGLVIDIYDKTAIIQVYTKGMYDAISSVQGVSNVHDLHIWSISHGHSILSVHGTANDVKQAYHDIKTLCNQKNISHLTVQLQPRTIDGCVTCSKESEHLCR